jgi:hypothetical protein
LSDLIVYFLILVIILLENSSNKKEETMSKSVKSQKIRRLRVDRTTGVDKIDSFVTQLGIEIPGLDESKYEVGWKDYQNDLPDYFQDEKNTITWFNNFYVKIQDETVTAGRYARKYILTIQKPPAGKKLCYFDPVDKVPKGIDFSSSSTTVTIELDLADPPTGMYP